MARRYSSKRKSQIKKEDFEEKDAVVEEDVVAEVEQPVYTYSDRKPATIKLQLRMDFKLKLPGPVTGKLYIWERAGWVTEIDEADKELAYKRFGGKTCCGGSSDNNELFFVIE